MEVANILAYYDTAKITAVKKIYSSGPWIAFPALSKLVQPSLRVRQEPTQVNPFSDARATLE
jgi:hypothetical protein